MLLSLSSIQKPSTRPFFFQEYGPLTLDQSDGVIVSGLTYNLNVWLSVWARLWPYCPTIFTNLSFCFFLFKSVDILKRCRWDSPVSEFNGFVGLNFSNFSVYCWVAHGSDISTRYIFMCLVSLLAFHAVAVQWNSHTCWEPFQYSSFYENGSVISTLYSLQNFQVTLTRLENPFVSSEQVWRLSNAIVPAHFTSLNKRWKIDWNLRKQLPRCWTDFFRISSFFVVNVPTAAAAFNRFER